MSDDKRNISDLLLERFALEELDESEMNEIQKIIDEDESVKQRLEDLRKSDEEILAEYAPEKMAEEILEKFEDSKQVSEKLSYELKRMFRAVSQRLSEIVSPPFTGYAFGSAFVLLIGFLLISPSYFGTRDSFGPDRLKGAGSHLLVYRQTGETYESLSEETKVKSGDVIQISYVASGAQFGMIFSIDGFGG